jgi:hypothetical protein
MSSNDQGDSRKKRNLCFLLGIVIVILIIAVIMIRNLESSPIHLNLPTDRYPTLPPSAPAYTIAIHSIDPSGISGTATFEDVSGAVAILLHIDGLEEESISPVEIHYGACAAPGPLAYALISPDAGESETDLSINLKQFNTQKPLAVILYRSTQDRSAIACGDIP